MNVGCPHLPLREHTYEQTALKFPEHAEGPRGDDAETGDSGSRRTFAAVQNETSIDTDRGCRAVLFEGPCFEAASGGADND
jgi:hypothetical protein